VRIHWTNTALGHLLSIYEYIGQNSPAYADRVIDRLTRRSEQIEASQIPEDACRSTTARTCGK